MRAIVRANDAYTYIIDFSPINSFNLYVDRKNNSNINVEVCILFIVLIYSNIKDVKHLSVKYNKFQQKIKEIVLSSLCPSDRFYLF